jgi:hypothetical protein
MHMDIHKSIPTIARMVKGIYYLNFLPHTCKVGMIHHTSLNANNILDIVVVVAVAHSELVA